MNLGANIAYWGLGHTADEQLRVVQEADRLGYDSAWAAEASRYQLRQWAEIAL